MAIFNMAIDYMATFLLAITNLATNNMNSNFRYGPINGEVETVFPVNDSSRYFPFIGSVRHREGGPADQHLIHDHSERPPVTGVPISLMREHFWCYIVGGSYSTVSGFPPRRLPLLGSSLRVTRRSRHEMMSFDGVQVFVKVRSVGFSVASSLYKQD